MADDLGTVLAQNPRGVSSVSTKGKDPKSSASSSPELVDEEDANSTSTEIIGSEQLSAVSSDKTISSSIPEKMDEQPSNASTSTEAAAASTTEGESATAAAPPPSEPFKLTIPEPVEKATQIAIKVVQQWWVQVEPLLKQLLKQLQEKSLVAAQALQEKSKPLVAASQEQLAKVALHFKPQTDQAAALIAEWQEKLSPHTTKVMEAVKAASEAVRVHAYEPALAYIATASVYLREHSVQLAALVAKKAGEGLVASQAWLEAQRPVMIAAWHSTQEHAKAAMEALLKWKAEVEPLALAQLEELKKKSIELSIKGMEQAKVLSAQAGVKLVELKEAIPPATVKVKEWAVEQGKVIQAHPATKAAQAWTDEQVAKVKPHIDPIVVPVATVVEQWTAILMAKWAVLSKQLEAPAEAAKKWLVETAKCLCLPLAKPLKFDAAAEADYPPPVQAPAAVVD